jgi:integrase
MFLSKRKNGVYYLWYDDESGRRQKISTKSTSKREANRFMQEFIKKGREPKLRPPNIQIAKFQKEFLAYSAGIHASHTQRLFATALRELNRIIGEKTLRSVSIRDVERFLSVKKSESSDVTARTYLVTLASAFQTAVRWKYIQTNPFHQVEKPKLPEKTPVYLSKDEFRQLFSSIAEEDLRILFLVAVSTGIRLGEILNLEWSDIDFSKKVIHVRNRGEFTTKSKRNRIIPMTEQVYKLLSDWKKKASSEIVFHDGGRRKRRDLVSRKFKEYITKLGLNDCLHFHSLRHTFASWLVQDGVSLYEVQKLLGHSNITVTQVYSHLQPETLHATVNRLSLSTVPFPDSESGH